jgi:hypothetical protein
MLRSLLASCAFVLTAPSLTSGVLVVDDAPGPGVTHTNLSAAITAAADGDTILVRPGQYGPFLIDGKSLELVADGAPSEVITAGENRVQNLAAHESVVLRGLRMTGILVGVPRLFVEQCDGSVLVEDCDIHTAISEFQGLWSASTYVRDSQRVVFTRSTLATGSGGGFFVTNLTGTFTGPHGLMARDSHVALYDCVVQGTTSPKLGGQGGHGAHVLGGSLFASGCTFRGGQGGVSGFTTSPFGPISVPGGTGGDGVQLTTASTSTPAAVGRFVECTFEAGAGGTASPGASAGAPGQPWTTWFQAHVTFIAEPARSFDSTSPVHAGGSTTLTFGAPANELVFTAASLGMNPTHFPALAGTLVPTLPFVFTTIGTMPASGSLVLTLPLPTLPPGTGALHIVHQAVFGTSTGMARLGSPSTLHLLDPAY